MEGSQVQSSDRSAWIAAVAIACAVTLAYGAYITSTHAGREIAFSIGRGLPAALIIWGVLLLTLKNNLYIKSKKTLSLVAIVACLVVGVIGGHQYAKHHFSSGISETQTIFDNSLVHGKSARGAIEEPTTHSENTGDLEKMQVYIHNLVVQLAGVRNIYLKQIQATGYARILDPNRIKTDNSLDESFKILSEVKSINNRYEVDTKSIFKHMKSGMLNLDISETSKASMLSGFGKSVSKSKAMLAYSWSLEHDKVNSYNNIFVFLRQHRNAWSIQSGQFVFTNQSDLDEFNNYINQLNAIVLKQQSMRQQKIKKTDKFFNDLQHTVQ